MMHTPLPSVTRSSLNGQVYDPLRAALLEGRLRPHQRLKIRDVAAAMQVSETPVRTR
jgi:DNA-binding GntR family transcriptional regulator